MLAGPVWGQDVPPANTGGVEVREGGAVLRYGPDYFTAQTAITARDLLRTIPGAANIIPPNFAFLNADKRGFGSEGDQVLINGKRQSGKSNNIAEELERIQASQVAYIDVIRGTAEGLDVRSEGLIVNIVLKEDAGSSGSWQAHMWTGGRGEWTPDAMVSYSDTIKGVRYQASVTLAPYNRANNFDRDDILSDIDGNPFEARRDRRFDKNDELSFTGKASFPIKETGSANINFQIADKGEIHPRTIEIFDLDGEGGSSPRETIENFLDVDKFETEVGGDIEIPAGAGKVHGRFIYSRKEEDRLQSFGVVPVDGESFDPSLEATDQVAQELIFRGGYQRQSCSWRQRLPGFHNQCSDS